MLAALLFFITGCSCGDNDAGSRIAAQVNKYKMTADEVKYELKNAPHDEKELVKTESGKKQYLGALIEKQVLLQEAQRRGIDREKDFMKTIENYWEQALLRIMLERKSRELSGLIHVYDNEVTDYYKDSGETKPLSKVRDEIREAIRRQKEEDAMNAWINELKNNAHIKIDENAIGSIFSEKE